MAIKKALTAEQKKELDELYEQFVIATADAGMQLRKNGMDSKEFETADP